VSENSFRKWMVLIAAVTLLVAIIRLWHGGCPPEKGDPAE